MSDAAYSEVIRINQIGAGLSRHLEPDAETRARIAEALDLQSLDRFQADLTLSPTAAGWRLSGRVIAEAVQTCGVTLEPLPVAVDSSVDLALVEATPDAEAREVEVSLDDDAPDVIEDARIDLGQYAVEQLALSLDPFPRKPGVEFEPPAQTEERSPFAVLKAIRNPREEGEG